MTNTTLATDANPQTVRNLLLVGDYGEGDLAKSEVVQKLHEQAEQYGITLHIDYVSVPPFDTKTAAAVVALAVKSGKYDTVYHNVAPRKDEKHKPRTDNIGEGLAYSACDYGGHATHVIGVNSTNESEVNTFSLLQDVDPTAKIYDIPKCRRDESQFRSRDNFPEFVARATDPKLQFEKELGKALDITPHGLSPNELVVLRSQAQQLLDNIITTDLNRHHDIHKGGYITVIAPHEEKKRTVVPHDPDTLEKTLASVSTIASDAEIDTLPVKTTNGFKWLESAFTTAQLALNYRGKNKRQFVVLSKPGETLENAEHLYRATLDNGVEIITNDPRTLAFTQDRLETLTSFPKEGRRLTTQENCGITVSGNGNTIAPEEQDRLILADATTLPTLTPVYVDGYGNTKFVEWKNGRFITSQEEIKKELIERAINSGIIRPDEYKDGVLKPGLGLKLHIHAGNKIMVDVLLSNGSFEIREGSTALSRGSSGWKGKDKNFPELFERGGNAAAALGHLQPGDPIFIRSMKRFVRPTLRDFTDATVAKLGASLAR